MSGLLRCVSDLPARPPRPEAEARPGLAEWPEAEPGSGPEVWPGPTGEPAAAWTTVCFHPARSRGRAGGRPVSLVWRSDVARGPVLVRTTAVPDPAGQGAGAAAAGGCPDPRGGRPPCDVHLRADPDGSELAHHADVLVARAPLPPSAARRRARELLAAHPGCLVVAVPDVTAGCVVGVRDGAGGARCVRSRPDGPRAAVPTPLFASVVHAWVVAGSPLHELRSVSCGPARS
ncbi:hypothetical protein ACH41E_00980 [Streptomyces sp. NPDC020412]|uniref:hypothetical protein n=1 Tax=Streptomyces sp. NPDC020412 TaxID=3365073 RepID=UPI0037B8B677